MLKHIIFYIKYQIRQLDENLADFYMLESQHT